jgi:hypothetical protein
MPINQDARKHVWKVAKRATNFQDVFLPEGAIYKTFPAKVIKGKLMPAQCVYSTDFDALKKRNHITITRIIDGRRMRPEYVDPARGVCNGIKAFAMTINLDEIEVKAPILRREIAPLAPKERKVGAYIQRARKDNGLYREDEFVTNRCRVGMRIYSNEMYEHERMGVR